MSILIEEYKNYKENGIEEPEAVIKFTKEYKKPKIVYFNLLINLLNTKNLIINYLD